MQSDRASDEQFRTEGIRENLLDLRDSMNAAIKAGKCYCKNFSDDRMIRCTHAFISNPCGYFKVFLRGEHGELLEHDLHLTR